MSKFLSRDVWTIHGHVLQEWTRCVFNNFSRNSTVFVSFGLHANIVEEYVLLSALLHDQSCLQSSPSFQHQFVYARFWRPFCLVLVGDSQFECKGVWTFFNHWFSTSTVVFRVDTQAHQLVRTTLPFRRLLLFSNYASLSAPNHPLCRSLFAVQDERSFWPGTVTPEVRSTAA